MTQHNDLVYAALMRDEIRGAMEAAEGMTKDEFVADKKAPLVAAYHFTRLAERPPKASMLFREAHPEIPWGELAAIRSRTEPEFLKEDPEAMWQIIVDELPPIAAALEALLPGEALWRYRAEEEDDDGAASEGADGTPLPLDQLPIALPMQLPMPELVELCGRYDVRRIRVFGSVLRDDFGPESDVDMMVDFGPGAPQGWDVFRFDDEMSELLGHKADVMHGRPIRYIRQQVLAEAVTIYQAGAVAWWEQEPD
jgi:predicted nucleotidyltransferase/uncharacterized protein with HEPN domain